MPSQGRLYYIRYAMKMGWSIEKINRLTNIDPFFLDQVQQLVEFEDTLCDVKRLEDLPREAKARNLQIAIVAVPGESAQVVTEKLVAVSLGLIMGGALSNGLDRILIGGVADFFSLHAWGFYWYVFNIADVAIVAGVAGLLYDSFAPSRNRAAKST